MLTMASALDRAVRIFGARRAIADAERDFTWSEHIERARRAASVLAARGVAPGERFGILSRNSFRHAELLHAGYLAGFVPVPVNVRLAPPEIGAILADAEVKVLAVDAPFVPLLAHAAIAPFARGAFALGAAAIDGLAASDSLLAAAAPITPREPDENDDATLLYTGGTTGRSKGVRLSHRNIVANGLQNIPGLGVTERDVYLHVAPMFHSADLLGTATTLMGGGHSYLTQVTPESLLGAIQDRRATLTMLPPTVIINTLQKLDTRAYDLRSFRFLYYGSAPMAPEWTRRAIAAFPGVEIAQGYGLTETAPILTHIDFAEHQRAIDGGDHERLKSVGRALPGVDLRVVDDAGRELPLGAPGEIVVRGPNVTRGYLNNPTADAAALRNGWFHTGDIGRLDHDGYLYLLDRKKDMIITGGENVYSSEVEQVIYKHPQVSECAVIGMPHPTWGEALVAIVVPAPGATIAAEQLIEHCRAHIGGYKIPRQWRFVRELPKSAMGKILKTELRKQVSAE